MNIEELREYCLSKKAVAEDFPFDNVSLVLKVEGKMFSLIALDAVTPSISLKCNPKYAIELREKYIAVQPRLSFQQKTLEYDYAR